MASNKNPHYNRTKFLLVFTITVFILAGLRALFGFPIAELGKANPQQAKQTLTPLTLLKDDSITNINIPKRQVNTPSHVPSRLPSFRGDWNEAFADSQAVQIQAAETNGIRPVESREELQQLVASHQLLDIRHSPLYCVDSLTHSVPYLVPQAQELLRDIANNFLDSIQSRGLPPHLLIVSSVLRTDTDVKSLQQGNKNATENSCHRYATTIDITYRRFQPLTGHPDKKATLQNEQLKLALAEVLYDLRQQGRCYVKYERKQACFHLTVR